VIRGCARTGACWGSGAAAGLSRARRFRARAVDDTMPSMKTLYVGCALRGAPVEFVTGVEALKKELEHHFEVLHFVGLHAGVSAQEIYETDIALAAKADLMLALVDVPSTGLGMEVARRHELGKPTVIAYHRNTHPSAMVLGIAEVAPHFSIVAYGEQSELVAAMRSLA
jgi:hypothetical protein